MTKHQIHTNAVNRLSKELTNYQEEIIQLKREMEEDKKDSPFHTRNLNERLEETLQAILIVEKDLKEQKKLLEEINKSQDMRDSLKKS